MKILVLPGDGIGPEITEATLTVLDRANARYKLGLEWQNEEIGLGPLKKRGSTFPEDVMETARKAPGIILGPVDHLQYPSRDQGGINPSGELRVKLDLFANIRPAKSRMGVGLTGKPVDLVIFRECTEGFYSDRNMFMGRGEFMPTEDMAIAVRKVTARQCDRISRVAFDWARKRRKKVTAVHKANVLHISDGLFPARSAQGGERISGRRARRENRRRDGGAARARPVEIRLHRHRQHVRRHPFRRGVRDFRQPRSRRLRDGRRRRVLRAGAARLRRRTSRARTSRIRRR